LEVGEKPIITIKNISKSFGDVVALKNINLKISEGIFGLIGPNGSGKSTLIKILLGLVKPDTGNVKIFGLDPFKNRREILKQVGVLHENMTFYEYITGIKYLIFVAKLYGFRRRDAEIKAIQMLKLVNLLDAAQRPIKTYSAGMKQRLGIAQALIGEPKLVFLDEPTANLDPEGRIELLEKIGEMANEQKTTFIIATHILPELEKIVDNIAIIYNGEILKTGSIQEISKILKTRTLKIYVREAEKLAKLIKSMPQVESIDFKHDQIIAKVTRPESFHNQLMEIARENNVEIFGIEPLYTKLEQIFLELTRGRK